MAGANDSRGCRKGSPSGRAGRNSGERLDGRPNPGRLTDGGVGRGNILLFLTGPIAHLPKAVLGAAIVAAAIGLIDISAWRRLAATDRVEVAIAAVTAVGVVVVGVLEAVVFAVGLTILDAVRRSARPGDAVLGYDPVLGRFADVVSTQTPASCPASSSTGSMTGCSSPTPGTSAADARGRPRGADHHTLARAGRRVHRPDRLDRTGGARATHTSCAKITYRSWSRECAPNSGTACTTPDSTSRSERTGSIRP